MAHIADCMRTNTTQDTSTHLQNEESTLPREPGNSWTSTHPSEGQKYHLYPTPGRITPSSGRSTPDLVIRSASSLAMRTSPSLCDLSCYQQPITNRTKTKDVRGRRKISISEIGPMTTVQEAPMDSPTIPGRPPLHERSISAPAESTPGNNWRQCPFGDAMTSCITGPVLRPSETVQPKIENSNPVASSSTRRPNILTPPALRAPMARKRNSMSPQRLAPLVIPTKERVSAGRSPLNNLLDDDRPPEVPPKSPRKSSPNRKVSGPVKHMTASSAALVNSATPTTPSSATDGRASPKPFVAPLRCDSPATGHNQALTRDVESPTPGPDRGRPIRRTDSKTQKTRNMDKRPRSGKTSPTESHKFEHLPRGYRAEDAVRKLSNSHIAILQGQAIGQAEKFEVLTHRDVERLSKELRALNERCEYLRKTFNSLRSGRRSLHNRMITYLRAPRLAQFSRESILKQEEALAELDISIDDWIDKLAQAENRRAKTQTKLVEHVAATLSLKPECKSQGEHTPPRSPQKAESRSPNRVDRGDVESIKIYADSNVYALLADVEQEIGRMVDFHDGLDGIDGIKFS